MSRQNRKKTVSALISRIRANPCVDCGQHKPGKMTFDHLPEKGPRGFDIANAASYSYLSIFLELKKCELVCVECHSHREVIRQRFGDVIKSVFDVLASSVKAEIDAVASTFELLKAASGLKKENIYNHKKKSSKTRRRLRQKAIYDEYRATMIPETWKQWSAKFPIAFEQQEPHNPCFVTKDYVEALAYANRVSQKPNDCQIIEHQLSFYVVLKQAATYDSSCQTHRNPASCDGR